MELFGYMIVCLLITIFIECGLAYLFKYPKADLLLILGVNIMTNPLLVSLTHLFNILYGNRGYYLSIFILEVFVFIIEGVIYKLYLEYKKVNPFVISLLLNLVSFACGFIINLFIN